MDRREKIKEIILSWTDDTSDIDELLDKDVEKILALFTKPPLLSDEEISERWHFKEHSDSNDGSWHYRLGALRWIAQAQREADIKHWGLE